MDRLFELPVGWTLFAFWCLAMMRSNGAYWIGRAIVAGTSISRFADLLDSPLYQRAQAMAERWGVLAVPLSFLTVGVQTFVQISAGVTRMPLRLYLPAVAVGSVMWGADLRHCRHGGDPGLAGDRWALAGSRPAHRRDRAADSGGASQTLSAGRPEDRAACAPGRLTCGPAIWRRTRRALPSTP